ncbi:putative RNA-binding protein [Trypanosoma rangeli]|uniref:Putative RNA-binding protein n=1 Tax=Trypanosoma rangeli TaxID=5698 RepID=A0A422NSU1_TRYRA|nr:putative RNA-binding protein [Trypanosoma rangeli]RNF08537.1 putative RNA-binding protein [Trypanosoma rangeli]|eukprot:RNF08537.1 putative RNA-binding protein [Trypanosoma rangeli]
MSGPMRDVIFTPLQEGRAVARRDRDFVPTSIIIDKMCRVYVTQIPLERIERDGANALRAEFEAFGPVESYKMFTERSGRFIGSVLCTYRNPADASAAVQNMNGQQIESSVLQVSLSRDHSVVTLRQAGPKGRYGGGSEEVDGGGKWQHDQYQALLEGGSVGGEMVGRYASHHGGRGGGRGRRGGRSGLYGIDEAFERYIASRDKEAVEHRHKVSLSGGEDASKHKETGTSEGSGVTGDDNVDNGGAAPSSVGGSHEDEQAEQ